MTSPSLYLFSPPPLMEPADSVTPTADCGIFDYSATGADSLMDLLSSYVGNMNEIDAVLDEMVDQAINRELATTDNDKQTIICPDPFLPKDASVAVAKSTKPTKPVPSMIFPAQAFYIDPVISLPTPVDDKYPLSTGMGAYMLRETSVDPTLSLPTPTKDKDDAMQQNMLDIFVVDPALENASAFPTTGIGASSPSPMPTRLPTRAMRRSSFGSSPSASTMASDIALQPSPPLVSPTELDAAVTKPTPSVPVPTVSTPNRLPPGFPTHLALSYPARSGVAVLNAKSQPVGWDCGPATVSLFEAKYGPGSNGPLSREVQPGIAGGAPELSLNWRLYGDGRLGVDQSRAPVKPEPAESERLRVPSPSHDRKIAPRKPSSSRLGVSTKVEVAPEQARAIWMQYYAAAEDFRMLRLPSVLGPWEPECRCPFANEGSN